MSRSVEQLVGRIHDAPTRMILAVSGGGSRAIYDLLAVPGASRTLLEASVPYSAAAVSAWLGARPERFCTSQTARAMAVAAFHRAREYAGSEAEMAGVGCAAGLVTDRPKRGEHRIHVALQDAARTVAWSLQLQKGLRTRVEEEDIAARMVLGAVAEGCRIDERLDLPLVEGERVETQCTEAPAEWQELFLGRTEAVCHGPCEPPVRAILPGAFNPLHAGHRRMAEIAREVLRAPVAMEISIVNVDKPPLDYYEIARRVEQFPAEQAVWFSRAETFEQKSRLFPGATFIVGTDTLRRIAAPVYYGDDEAACGAALQRIAERGCRFLVFGIGDWGLGIGDWGLGIGDWGLGIRKAPPLRGGVVRACHPNSPRVLRSNERPSNHP
jgi:nicotinamide mononucleotide (NMN) deamidase PncC